MSISAVGTRFSSAKQTKETGDAAGEESIIAALIGMPLSAYWRDNDLNCGAPLTENSFQGKF